MPLYEYECNRCGETFELIVPISEKDNAKECPQCHSAETNRKISVIASRFGLDGGSLSSSTSCGSSGGFS